MIVLSNVVVGRKPATPATAQGIISNWRQNDAKCLLYITPHEIHTLDVSDTLLLQTDVCCQCTNVVRPDLESPSYIYFPFAPSDFNCLNFKLPVESNSQAQPL